MLFADIVGSTERVSLIGDDPWRELLNSFFVQVREVLQEYRGREVNTSGDGFLAAFDGPARAIRCANALTAVVHSLGLETPIYTPIFALSRVAGWAAHVIEQLGNNRLIRPRSLYTGPATRTVKPIAERG